jgi:uncharacterized membrane protein
MKSIIVASVLLWLILAAMAVQIAYHYPQLPPRVASHFDIEGHAAGWMSPTQVVRSQLAAVGLTLACLLAAIAVSTVVRSINVPHKEYWLAPEHRRETRIIIVSYMLWMTDAVALLLLADFELMYLENLGHPQVMQAGPWCVLAAFTCFMIAGVVLFIRCFARGKPQTKSPPG